ncbi:MAG: hypothetical protein DCO98_02740 [Altererythrobacter sp. XM-24bin4]|nr:MAG: hypothetical protein DCO98_02740 [Altererythrobacter sp. XM-24bin4]
MVSIVLARTLSVEEFGMFGFIISLATVLAIPVTAGLPTLLTREVAGYSLRKNWGSYRGLFVWAHVWVVTFSAVVALGILVWLLLAREPNKLALMACAAIMPFLGFTAVRTGILKGLQRPILAEAPSQIIQPVLLIAGYLALAYFGLSSVESVLVWYVSTAVIVFLIALTLLLRARPAAVATASVSYTEMPRWFRSLPAFAMIGAVVALNAQIAILLLGSAGLNEQVAFMRVAERGAHLVVFPLYFAGAVLAPYLVAAIKAEDRAELQRINRFSSRLAFSLSLSITVLLAGFGTEIIALTFGATYSDAALAPMLILVAAQTVAAALGASNLLLTMSENENLALLSQAAGLLIIFIVTLMLISRFGAVGAATGAASGIIVNRGVDFIAVRVRLGFWPGIF